MAKKEKQLKGCLPNPLEDARKYFPKEKELPDAWHEEWQLFFDEDSELALNYMIYQDMNSTYLQWKIILVGVSFHNRITLGWGEGRTRTSCYNQAVECFHDKINELLRFAKSIYDARSLNG